MTEGIDPIKEIEEIDEMDGAVREIEGMMDVWSHGGDVNTNLNRERNRNGDGIKTGNRQKGIERDGVTARTVRNDQIDRIESTDIGTDINEGTEAVGCGFGYAFSGEDGSECQ